MANLTNNPDRLVVGMTGGIAVGNSTATNEFVRLGVQAIEADKISHEVTAPGRPAYEEMAGLWPQFVGDDGYIVRRALRNYIFRPEHSEERKILESITHPRISEEINRQLDNPFGYYTVIDSPLLLETGGDNRVDTVLVVDVEEETQIERAKERDGSDASIKEIMKLQLSGEERLRRADDVIRNNGSKAELLIAINAIHFGWYLPLAFAKSPPDKNKPAVVTGF